jgi:hypothetical protein
MMADNKITALTLDATPASTDLLMTVDDPAGTPINKKATIVTVVAAGVADESITYAKMQHVSDTDKVLGRSTAGSGDVEEIACTATGRSILDDTSTGAVLTTIGALPLAGGTMSGNIVMADGGTIGQAAGPLLTFDDTNNYLEITGANVGIATATPIGKLGVTLANCSNAGTGIGANWDATYALFGVAGNSNGAALGIGFDSPSNTAILASGAPGIAWASINYFGASHVMHVGANTVFIVDSSENVGIGTAGGLSKLSINGGLHVGGDSDAGDNNLLVDGTATITGAFGCNGATAQTGYANAPWDEPGAGTYGVDSAAHMAALVELVQDIQAALVANGILATPA